MPYRPLHRDPDQTSVLAAALARAAELGGGGVAAFDLDGCLMDNRPRQIHIIREFASRHGLTELYLVEPEHIHDWSLEGALARGGVPEDLIREHIPALERWWKARFYRGSYMSHDHAMPGAAAFLRAILGTGAHIAYLSGRLDAHRRQVEESLDRFGLPRSGERVHYLLAPPDGTPETTWKVKALDRLRRVGTPFLLADNRVENVLAFRERCPGAMVLWLDTDQSHMAHHLPPDVCRVKGFLI